jgi:uncharacterized protein YdeI (YjbR/CyaY-like superfamily)
MIQKDKRVDDYIANCQPFARPILNHLRKLVHTGGPNVQETIKWGFPNFEYKGILCNMAGFKQHCAFNFWKGSIMKDFEKMKGQNKEGMGSLGKIEALNDLPPDKTFISWIKEAMKLNEENIKVPERKKPATKKDIIIPEILQKALARNKTALNNFINFSPSHKKEYIEWIAEGKTEETRARRVSAAIEWISEGKGRNWKYEKK